MGSWPFLGITLLVAILAKNQSLVVAAAFVSITKLIPVFHSFFPQLRGKGINIGVTIIIAAILVPIVTGEIGLRDLLEAFKSPIGWVAVLCSGPVVVLSSKGIGLVAPDPQITVILAFDTILGAVFLEGIAAGLVIASGITYYILQVPVLGK